MPDNVICVCKSAIKKDPQTWGRKQFFNFICFNFDLAHKKRSPNMGTKTDIIFRGSFVFYEIIKKDPQTWGRKPCSLLIDINFHSLIKKDPQTWGRKPGALYNATPSCSHKKRSPNMGTKTIASFTLLTHTLKR